MRPSSWSVLALLGLTAPAAAASLTGTVRTTDGTPLPQVVLLLKAATATVRTVITGPEGRYRLADLAAGRYSLETTTPGFVASPAADVILQDADVRLDVTLAVAPVREHVLVAATRTEAALSTLGVSATVLDRDQIEERDASDVPDLLRQVPGVAVARSGGVGIQSSVFVRGGESRFARILVDGVPVNEPGGAFNFGGQLPLELERVEVVRGAASSLYGTDALAGVVQFVTRRAAPGEAPGVHAEAEGGGFAWRRYNGGTSGRAGALDWNAGLQRLETDNEEPNSAFSGNSGAASLGFKLSDRSLLRVLLRGESSDVGTPGPTAYRRPDLDASFERQSFVLGGQFRHVRDQLAHEVRVGVADSDQLSLNPLDSGPYVTRFGSLTGPSGGDFPDPLGFQNDTRRLSLGYQVEAQAGQRHFVTGGVDLERETGALGSRAEALLTPDRTNVGAYVQDRVVVGGRVFLTAGARVERNDNYGTKVVPRGAVAWRLRDGNATTLKASAGAGIKEPGFFESFGVSTFALGNPDLRPERSHTFDVGLEQRLLGSRLRAEATLFHHTYRDQIAYTLDFTTFLGTYVNLAKTRARGIEAVLEASPTNRLHLRAEYTWLDGEILVSGDAFGTPVYEAGRELLRRPRHQGSIGGRFGGARVTVGADLLLVGRRTDSDFAGLNLDANPGYVRLDARIGIKVTRGLEVFLAGENLADRVYQEVLGYPALGRSVRGGVRFRSGERK